MNFLGWYIWIEMLKLGFQGGIMKICKKIETSSFGE